MQPGGVGKGVQKKIARKKGEKLHVYVNWVLNAITGGNATPVTNELGLQIRRLCPLQRVKSWRKIDQSTKDGVVQAVIDKFVIGDDFDNDEQAQQILDRKAYLLYKDWRYNLNHPPSGVSFEDWKYLIDVAWKDESHLDDMVNLQVVATDAGLPLTHEELSRQVLGAKFFYLRGCGIGPQPSSTTSSAARARDKHMESIRVELEVLREERQKDHEELLKEKEECQRDHEELLKEKEKRQRDHEELLKEKDEGQRD
ncbi:hypothetical protein ACSBR1_011466 [Camellia fascicularis]